jgi:hypothetical protein
VGLAPGFWADGYLVRAAARLASHWNADKAVKVVEDVIGDGGRPRWIDYRTTFASGETLHLHVVARGDYDTGVFTYNLIRRGER